MEQEVTPNFSEISTKLKKMEKEINISMMVLLEELHLTEKEIFEQNIIVSGVIYTPHFYNEAMKKLEEKYCGKKYE